MRDLYLRFANADQWAALKLARDPGLLEIDVIGSMVKVVTPAAIVEGIPVPAVTTPIVGWHVNIRCADARDLSALAPYQISPATPSRVWL